MAGYFLFQHAAAQSWGSHSLGQWGIATSGILPDDNIEEWRYIWSSSALIVSGQQPGALGKQGVEKDKRALWLFVFGDNQI